jgi:hypothetical protein
MLGVHPKDFFRIVTKIPEEMRPKLCDFPWKLLLYGEILVFFPFYCFSAEVFSQ